MSRYRFWRMIHERGDINSCCARHSPRNPGNTYASLEDVKQKNSQSKSSRLESFGAKLDRSANFSGASRKYFGVIIIGRVYCFSSGGSLVIVTTHTHKAKSTLCRARERELLLWHVVLFQCSG